MCRVYLVLCLLEPVEAIVTSTDTPHTTDTTGRHVIQIIIINKHNNNLTLNKHTNNNNTTTTTTTKIKLFYKIYRLLLIMPKFQIKYIYITFFTLCPLCSSGCFLTFWSFFFELFQNCFTLLHVTLCSLPAGSLY